MSQQAQHRPKDGGEQTQQQKFGQKHAEQGPLGRTEAPHDGASIYMTQYEAARREPDRNSRQHHCKQGCK